MKAIPESIRKRIIERDEGRCRICGAPGIHIHHIYGRNAMIPAYLGIPFTPQNNHEYNLILLCAKCHERVHRIGMTQHEREKLIVANMMLGR